MFKNRIDFLNDAIAYYWGKPERRCTMGGDNTNCAYSASGESDGCAIGRHLSKELAKELDENMVGESGVSNFLVFEKLPKWMRSLGQEFLLNCQSLHDDMYLSTCDKLIVIDLMDGFVDIDQIIFPS